jgi:peptide/nickel transport system ATP-binding protein
MTTGAGPTLRIEDLSIAYRRRGQALGVVEGLSLEIARGEAYGLVGESGCGKSTVALAIMRYLPANAVVRAGTIDFEGRDLLTAGERELRALRGDRVAMVYQDPGSALNPTMRVGEQVAEVYRHHRSMDGAASAAAAREMLGRVRISDPAAAAERYPHELSGGQQQRVMIAMALATEPALLILDEPTTGLDATVEAEVLDLVEALRTEFEASVLFISHNLGIVSRLCDRVGVLYGGRLVEQAASSELFARPRHPYTLGLLRCLPRLGMRKGVDPLSPIPGSLPPLGHQTPGCVFADRCALARDRCRQEAPPPYDVGPGHTSRCHYAAEVPGIPAASPQAAPAGTPPGPAAEPLLRVEGVRKTYRAHGRDVTAVEDVSFAIGRGEVLGLVGESGSGKTSLAKCIVGLVGVDAGELVLEEDDRPSAGDARHRLQMIFQNPDSALNPRHTVERILGRAVRLLAGLRGRGELRARVRELAASARLEERHLEVRPAALSGGLKQRVGIARAFAGTPSLVLCDEPVSALDVSVQAAILNLLARLQQEQGVSYLFISHDLAVVRYLADRIGVMYLGQLVEIGSADDVFRPPHHPYTEALLSAIPVIADGKGMARPRIRLTGPQPSPADPPSGCRFHTRCPRAMEVCRTTPPPWQEDVPGHRYLCHVAPADLREAQDDRAERVAAHA